MALAIKKLVFLIFYKDSESQRDETFIETSWTCYSAAHLWAIERMFRSYRSFENKFCALFYKHFGPADIP